MMYNQGFLKRQTVTQIVGLSLLGLFLLSAAGCGGTITSLSKDEFEKKVEKMTPDEVVKWLGKPTSVTDDDGNTARWHWNNACYDKTTGKKFNAELGVRYKQSFGQSPVVSYCRFSAD